MIHFPLGLLRARSSCLQISSNGEIPFQTARQLATRARTGKTANTLIFCLVILATVLCYKLFFKTYDRELHAAVTNQIGELFPDASIYVGRVDQDPSGRLIASDVRMASKGKHPRRQIFKADRVEIAGNLDLVDWMQDALAVEQADIYGAQLDVWLNEQGKWSVEAVIPRPKKKRKSPRINFLDATVRILQNESDEAKSIALHHIIGTIQPARPEPNHPEKLAPSIIHASFSGSGGGTIDRFNIRAGFDTLSKRWHANGSIQGLQLSRALLARVPTQLSEYLVQLKGVECEATANFEAQGSPSIAPTFKVGGTLTNGRLRDDRLPYPVDNLQGNFFCNNQQIQIRDLKATSSDFSKLELDADISNLTANAEITIVAEATNLELGSRLREALPQNLKEQWDRLQLSGRVSGSVRLVFDGTKWTPSMLVDCHNVAIRPWLFPYPVSDLRGKVSYQNSKISGYDLSAVCGGQPANGQFILQKIGKEFIGKLEIAGHGLVAVDENLLSALTPRNVPQTGAEKFVRQLHPSGHIHLQHAVFQRQNLDDIWHRTIDARVYNGTIAYEAFPYEIHEVRGRIYAQDYDWWLQSFEGQNDSGLIECSGTWNSSPQHSQIPLSLQFDARSIALDDELRSALSQEVQTVWDELRPSGHIDSVAISLNRKPDAPLQTRVELYEESRTNASTSRSLDIRPRSFPYQLSDIDCQIVYTPGFVEIRRASGRNGTSLLALTGSCEPTHDGRWQATVNWNPQTRLNVERQLLQALPKSIRESFVKVDFRGAIGVLGTSRLILPNESRPNLESFWNCSLAVENGQLGEGKYIGNLRGTMQIRGHSDGVSLNANGTLALDALTILEFPVNRLSGPFSVVGNRILFGKDVVTVRGSKAVATPLTANALSGNLLISGGFDGNAGQENLDINATLTNAQLSRVLREFDVEAEDTEANCNAQLNFHGVPWNPQTYYGEGNVHLADAQLYEMPFMIRLLRAAAVSASDDSAFQSADIDFKIDGNLIPLEIACDGDVMRLRGDGKVELPKGVELELYAYVGRRRQVSRVVDPILPGSRFSSLMRIDVTGSLDDPKMIRRPLPQIDETLSTFFPEFAERRKDNPLLPRRR